MVYTIGIPFDPIGNNTIYPTLISKYLSRPLDSLITVREGLLTDKIIKSEILSQLNNNTDLPVSPLSILESEHLKLMNSNNKVIVLGGSYLIEIPIWNNILAQNINNLIINLGEIPNTPICQIISNTNFTTNNQIISWDTFLNHNLKPITKNKRNIHISIIKEITQIDPFSLVWQIHKIAKHYNINSISLSNIGSNSSKIEQEITLMKTAILIEKFSEILSE